jgi:7-carboxy-7-deazaguanine synthase
MDISRVNPRVSRVMDLKPPASGELASNRYENIDVLTAHDQVKFVIQDETDYRWAVEMVNQYGLDRRCDVLFSPVAEAISPVWLAEEMIKDRLNVRFQLQLHKILWGNRQGV